MDVIWIMIIGKKLSYLYINAEVESRLKEFVKMKRVPIETELIKWWNATRFEHGCLFKVAAVVHSVPMTQVTVERLFSTFRFILSPQGIISRQTIKKIF